MAASSADCNWPRVSFKWLGDEQGHFSLATNTVLQGALPLRAAHRWDPWLPFPLSLPHALVHTHIHMHTHAQSHI
uniref:Uncharacterized protein n=1 Tax=Anguilla anguilla TaxID=7936 RepID=A0A0E9RKP8_ANGAN